MFSNAVRFSSLRGNPSMRNFFFSLCCIACCKSFIVISEGTIFPSSLNFRIISLLQAAELKKKKYVVLNNVYMIRIDNYTARSDEMISIINANPFSDPDSTSACRSSPAQKCVNPKCSTILGHWVPFPLPGPPACQESFQTKN